MLLCFIIVVLSLRVGGFGGWWLFVLENRTRETLRSRQKHYCESRAATGRHQKVTTSWAAEATRLEKAHVFHRGNSFCVCLKSHRSHSRDLNDFVTHSRQNQPCLLSSISWTGFSFGQRTAWETVRKKKEEALSHCAVREEVITYLWRWGRSVSGDDLLGSRPCSNNLLRQWTARWKYVDLLFLWTARINEIFEETWKNASFTLYSPSVCVFLVLMTVDCASALPLLQLYVMGRSPTALQGKTTGAPTLQLTWATNVTMMGLTEGRRGVTGSCFTWNNMFFSK